MPSTFLAPLETGGVSLAAPPEPRAGLQSIAASVGPVLRQWFGAEFTLIDAQSREIVVAADDQPAQDWGVWCELAAQVATRGEAALVAEEDPLATLAVPVAATGPLARPGQHPLVAVATFPTRAVPGHDGLAQAARLLGLSEPGLRQWLAGRSVTSVDSLLRAGRAFGEFRAAVGQLARVQAEVDGVSEQIAAAYEEISLLHRLTNNLRLSSRDEQLAAMALPWLAEVVPAEGLAIELLPLADPQRESPGMRSQSWYLAEGRCPLDLEQFQRLVARLGESARGRPLVANHGLAAETPAEQRILRELILVPLTDGGRLFGWMAAFNCTAGREFGTHEAQLMSSVATLLGIHSGNVELYRQQQELLTGVIRALTSAIDAKDPYTCGHSDRVARVAVRLAQDLGIEGPALQNIYLTGLLHDIGKIGIDDQVLRKPGRLSPAEFEHIKTHAELGYNILIDLKALGAVLPGVRHHHEAWDGSGYPQGLAGEQIPLLARIIAVADSFDAMGSDRPYRKGMDDERLNAILREGAGTQWDPVVVEAFFRSRQEIHEIARGEAMGYDPEVPQWVELQAYRPVRRGGEGEAAPSGT